MKKKIYRNFLEIKSIKFLKEKIKPHNDLEIEKLETENFQINKFFYKNIGKSYRWIDRLVWNDTKWMDYTNNSNLEILSSDEKSKLKDDIDSTIEELDTIINNLK